MTAAILDRMEADGVASVALDLRGIDPARFPNVFRSLEEAGLDPRTEPVPVSPAAHYTMGGVAVDLDGRSSLPGLYAKAVAGLAVIGSCRRYRRRSAAKASAEG